MIHDLERMAGVLDSIRIGVVAVDGKGRVELQNGAACRILGISAAVTLGQRLDDVLGPRHPVVALLAEALLNHREVSSHGCALPRRLGGSPLIADLDAGPLRLSEESDGAVLTLRDHTYVKELETLVDQRARSELFARLASGIAHEIRNPLGGIRGSAELLLGKLQDEALLRYPELIRDETDRILRLLDDLAQLTRGGDLRKQSVNVHHILDDLVELQRQSTTWGGIEVVGEFDPSIPDLELDPDRITQVFLNLVRNAVQAMNGSGRLTLRSRVASDFHVLPEERRRVRMVQIDVEDTGPGVAEEDLPHLFTPFFTRRERGTGLGLAIAQHWVVRHGGTIQLENLPARGTRVRVQLPVARPGAAS